VDQQVGDVGAGAADVDGDQVLAAHRAADFLRAERALKQGDRPGFESLRDRLRDYPLYPYLRFAELGDLKTASDPPMAAFSSEFPDTPLAERVRAVYVKRLGQEKHWAELARVYRQEDEGAERRCLYLRALSETGAADQALSAERMKLLWLVGQPQPTTCDPLFAAWRAQGGLTADLIWQRIRLALEANEVGLARHLKTWLPAEEQIGVDRWLALLAAHQMGERALLILDAGTAITYDLLLGEGRHLGGLILPGVHTMRQSLLANTQIPPIEPKESEDPWARDTATAIAIASLDAPAALAERLLRQLAEVADGSPVLITTGGDAQALQARIQAPACHVPDLVLQGLALVPEAT